MIMKNYESIIAKVGEPFPREGRRSPQINTLFFAMAFQQICPVKCFHKIGWLKLVNERWLSTSEEVIKWELREQILTLMRKQNVSCFTQLATGVLSEITQMIRLEQLREAFPDLAPNIIPVTNGILFWDPESRELKFRNYTREDLILESLTVPYIPNASAPLFEEKLQEIIPDADDRRVVQEYLGASLFPANRTRKFLLLQGEGGCGKSLLVLLLSQLLGPTRVFDLNFKNISGPFGFSDLTTQTLLTASEAVSRGLYSVGGDFVKKAVGGDYFQTAQKFKNDRVKHFGTYSLIIVTNNKMQVKFEGKGLEWKDRMLPVFFQHHIPEEQQNHTLVDQLITAEGSGILNWLLDGAERVRRNDWHIKLSVKQRACRDSLIDSQFSMETFVDQFVTLAAGSEFSTREAYQLYTQVQAVCDYEYLEERAFFRRFAKAMAVRYHASGCNTVVNGRTRGYRGFKLNNEGREYTRA